MRRLTCIGMGFSACALARRVAGSGWDIAGTSRTPEAAQRLETLGWRGIVFDGTRAEPRLASRLAETTHLLLSAPPGQGGDPLLAWHAADLRGAPQLEWIGYLSTIGVYGDHGGAWIDETTPAAPRPGRSQARLDAETGWLNLGEATGKRVRIFRLPGIYGPGRSAIDQLRAGTAKRIVKPGQVFNRIHVDDIAAVLAASADGRGRHAHYNLADDEPAPAEDVVAFAAGLIGVPAPPQVPFEAAQLSAMARSFYEEAKRVRNDRIKQDLGVRLQYPTYREGLQAIARVGAN